jgi:DNA-directed RNA polymerase specialized sigma24 family protein
VTPPTDPDLVQHLAEISTQLKRIAALLAIRALDALPDDSQKERVGLLDAADFSNAEIARLVGASESTVRKTRSRLRE